MFEEKKYHKEIMGWTSDFPEITETPSAHRFEMNCSNVFNLQIVEINSKCLRNKLVNIISMFYKIFPFFQRK